VLGGGNDYGLNMNDTRDFTFRGNVVTSNGPPFVLELSQRNSQNVVLDSNTFNVTSTGTGEYGAHWTITGNTFLLHPHLLSGGAALAIGGNDVLFSNNHVTGSSTVTTPLMMDVLALDSMVPYMGQIRIVNNTFDCDLTRANCLQIVSTDAIVSNNQFHLTGSGQVILVEGPLPQSVQVTNNVMSVQNGLGIVFNTIGADNSVISCNTVTGSGPTGIYVASPARPASGKDIVAGDTVSGFGTPIFVDTTMHPLTAIDYSTASCPGH